MYLDAKTIILCGKLDQSQSSAPFFHSQKKPTVSKNRKINIAYIPAVGIKFSVTEKGNKKEISRSKSEEYPILGSHREELQNLYKEEIDDRGAKLSR